MGQLEMLWWLNLWGSYFFAKHVPYFSQLTPPLDRHKPCLDVEICIVNKHRVEDYLRGVAVFPVCTLHGTPN